MMPLSPLMPHEDEKMVLRAFGRKPSLCIHELYEFTGIQYPELITALKRLLNRNQIAFMPDMKAGKDDRQYMLLGKVVMGTEQFLSNRLSPLMGLTEDAMRGRVLMIKRMKERLIVDWHGPLNVLLNDYEGDLKRVEALREPPDPDDRASSFDVFDRDLG